MSGSSTPEKPSPEKIRKAMQACMDYYYESEDARATRNLLSDESMNEEYAGVHDARHIASDRSLFIESALKKETADGIDSQDPTSGTYLLKQEIKRLGEIPSERADYDLKMLFRAGLIKAAEELGIELEPFLKEPRILRYQMLERDIAPLSAAKKLIQKTLNRPLNIFSADLMIRDIILPLPYRNESELETLGDSHQREQYRILEALIIKTLKNKGAEKRDKVTLTEEEFKEFTKVTRFIRNQRVEAGGSSANTLTTFSRLLDRPSNGRIHIDMLGILSDGIDRDVIKTGFSEAKINHVQPSLRFWPSPEQATSFVFLEPGGYPTIFTYPGNAKDLLEPEHVTDELINKCDVVFMQGSLWQKFKKELPDMLLNLRWKKDKEIWMALPTQATFDYDMPPRLYQSLIPSADVVLGNERELKRTYETEDFNVALIKLQEALAANEEVRRRDGKMILSKHPVAFITREAQGAIIVTPNERIPVAAAEVTDGEITNRLGAGDTAYAGFLAGRVADMSLEDSGKLAMELAAAKLKTEGTRLLRPQEALRDGSQAAKDIFSKFHAQLGSNSQLGWSTIR